MAFLSQTISIPISLSLWICTEVENHHEFMLYAMGAQCKSDLIYVPIILLDEPSK